MSTILETERLIVRHWRLTDGADAFAIYGDAEVTRYLADDSRDNTLAQTESWLAKKVETRAENEPLGIWAVEERASGHVIGHAILQHASINGDNRVELGYAFARAAWGHGYATELAHTLLRFGFDTLNLTEIYGVILPENTASRHVLEKIGMRSLGMGDYGGFPVEVLAIDRLEQPSRIVSGS